MKDKRFVGQLMILLLGIFSASTAVVFIKGSTINFVLMAGYRLLLAMLFLMPLYIRDIKKFGYKAADLKATIIPGLLLGVHFIAWIAGARMTPASNASLIVCMVPIATPFFLFLFIKERLNKIEIIATLFAVTGLIILGLADFNINVEYLKGDLVCFGAMLLFAVYLVLARKNRKIASIWLYIVPLYLIAGIACILIALALRVPFEMPDSKNLWCLLCLAVVPTILGHTSLNYAMKYFRGQTVSILTMSEFIIATILGYFFFKEVPHISFYLTAVLVLTSGFLVIFLKNGGNQGKD